MQKQDCVRVGNGFNILQKKTLLKTIDLPEKKVYHCFQHQILNDFHLGNLLLIHNGIQYIAKTMTGNLDHLTCIPRDLGLLEA